MNNNNRGNNNRRRGRGNNNRQQGGGQQTNRIDSRARGNAPQMLEKYRKLAHDAHLNGDRVQSEYYLQFADHYFRVIADARLRQEEQRARRDERWDGGEGPQGETSGEDDFSIESDFPTFDQPPVYTRREREERQDRSERHDRRREEPQAEQAEAAEETADESGARAANPYEPPENPFVRPSRNSARGLRPRREERQQRGTEGESLGLDPSSLPPAIAREEAPAGDAEPVAEAKPRRRATRRKVADAGDEGTEPAASVG